MKHKVCDLEGPLLDRAVSKAEGWADDGNHYHYSREWEFAGPIIERERITIIPWTEANAVVWRPDGNSVDWSQSGPVKWWAEVDEVAMGWLERCPEPEGSIGGGYGPTPLIAAMRAYVASKLGEEIELP